MKFLRLVTLLLVASLGSCLFPSPVKKESIRPAGYAESSLSGDLAERIGRSLAAVRRVTSARAFMDGADTSAVVLREGADAFLGLVLLSRAAGDTSLVATRAYKTVVARTDTGYPRMEEGIDEEYFAGYGTLIRALCEYYNWTGDSLALDRVQGICDNVFVPYADRIADYPLERKRFEAGDLFDTDPLETGNSLDPNRHEGEDSPGVGRRQVGDSFGADRQDGGDSLGAGRRVYDGWLLIPGEKGAVLHAFDGLALLYSFRAEEGTGRVLNAFGELFARVVDDPAGMSSAAYCAGLRGMMRYGKAKGSTGVGTDAAKVWEVFSSRALNGFHGVTPFLGDSTLSSSPSASSEAFIAVTWLWALTGDGDLLETAEKILYNAVLPVQSSDGTFAVVGAADHLDKIARCDADSCTGSRMWVEALPSAALFSSFVRDNKVLVPFFFEGELFLESKGIRVVRTTGYPAGRTVRFEVVDAPKRGIGLQFYFPSYMTMKSMTLNGTSTVSGTVNSVGLLELREVLRKGDVVDLTFAFGTKWAEAAQDEPRYKNMFRAVCGPLVLGYRADTVLWLERGVALKADGEGNFRLDDDFTYRRDTVTGVVRVLNAMEGDHAPGTVVYEPPVFRSVFQPLAAYGRGGGLPEYVLVKIERD